MNFQQPALGAPNSYYGQILTQLDTICELAYTESEMPINTFMNHCERLQLCDQSLLFIQKQDALPASLSQFWCSRAFCWICKVHAALNLSAKFATEHNADWCCIKYSCILPSSIICSALHPDPGGASGEESLILPAPQLLPCPGNSPLKSKADC